MDSKQQILTQFLKEGILLSPEALEKITESNAEQTLERARRSKAFVFTFAEERAEPVIEVRKTQKRVKLSPQDFATYYNTRFEGLKAMLQKKAENVVSVANARKSGSTVTTIGMVREPTQRGFTIEDTTGWAEVITKSEDVAADDVIAVRAGVKEEKLFAEEIIWPDVPMGRSHNHPDMKILLADKDGHKVEEGTVVITPEAVHGFDKKKTNLSNPGWITMNRGGGTATILVYRPEKPATQKEALTWLRRRHLSPGKNHIRGTDDPFLIEPIPDLLWIISSERWSDNYKGIVVVSSDGKEPAEVDLAAGNVAFQENEGL
jgi:DNA polymerase II small subunit/DNA polymerase delta subunit B